MKICLIENGRVLNIAKVNPDSIPDWAEGWSVATAGAEVGGTYVDGVFGPRPQAEIDSEQDAEIDAIASKLDKGDLFLRALGAEVFKLAKAADPTLTVAQFKKRIRDFVAANKS